MDIFSIIFSVLILLVTPTNQQSSIFYNPNVNINSRNRAAQCLRGDCYPETGDLLIGRTKFLHASSTCGITQPERYCVLGDTRDATKCFVCDSSEPYDQDRNQNSHTVENIVSRKQGDRFNRWWQSENGIQNVYIQFDLEAEFAFTHIIMTFKTFRPAAMIIEKSSNFGRSWKTYGYFASNCAESFPDIPTDKPKNLGELFCESKYSLDTPSSKGEVVFLILPPTLIQSKDPYSTEIQDLLKITNLRINFTKLHTFGDNLLDSREELKEKYYYSMYEMVVRGSCLCYGHASQCLPVEGVQYDSDKNGMVDGQCQCQHNTWGTNCELCLPLYNDRRWAPARQGQPNECKKCECNNHARSCRFDMELFEQTNSTSGGRCEDCQHSTHGIHCEKCKENYWRDPERPIDDISTCKPCKCDKLGSTNNGQCDPYTSEEEKLVAGRCHCKSLVEGLRCDRCQNGYFNLTLENPDGCEPCSCNLIGTTGNLGCDKYTGLCSCKQFVAGRACDQCLPGYFGLSSEDPNGCQACQCSPGGSYDSSCDITTGQCKCKPNMVGRTCEKPDSGFFCPTLDHLIYEAEEAKKSDERSQDYTRPVSSDRKQTWTSLGFVRVFEGGSLKFNVDNIFKTGHYELVIRYENMQPEAWEEVRIALTRIDGYPDSSGFCADYEPSDDYKVSSLPSNAYDHLIVPPFCLESNKKYSLKLDFVRFGSSIRDGSILIDSILLVPSVEDLPSLQGPDTERLKSEFNHYGCRQAQISIFKENLNENCLKFICNIGIHNEYALPCECNPTGSTSNICNEAGGECQCKPNVVGRKCDKCAASTWGFGPNGCQPCNCNSAGAKNNICDLETGQCNCYDKVLGKKCDECQPNFWRFPSCEPCNCNGFADSCNQTTGLCINCRDNTYGYNCEKCKDGYYGKPTEGQICKECMCPGGMFGNQFGSTCHFDERIDGVVCNCQEGYVGTRCEQCALNYYGNPMERGSTCKKCECNENIDMRDPTSCDQSNGVCKNCLYNTAGDHCEVCKPGFYGNASNHECIPCNCYTFGTEGHSAENCNSKTGQCKCLPNVVGMQCNSCKVDYYGLKSKEGCSYCNCDVEGTNDNKTSCDLFTGQCDCLASRGGRSCSECSYGYWGDPNTDCQKCECTQSGSISDQCDKVNGSCLCRKGIRGYHCDTCDRGTTGEVPNCTQCGECFDDWTEILNKIENDLKSLEDKASDLAVGIGSGIKDFTVEYAQLDERLSDVKKILALNFTDRQIKILDGIIQNIEKQLESKKESRNNYFHIENWDIKQQSEQLNDVKDKYAKVKQETESLTQQAISLKESFKTGAMDSINKAAVLSDEASLIYNSLGSKIDADLKPILSALQQKIEASKENFKLSDQALKNYYSSIETNLTKAMNDIAFLDGEICGIQNQDSKCDEKCGGTVCGGKCGSNSSECNGLVDSYWKVINTRKSFDDLYSKQEMTFKAILTSLMNSSSLLNNANRDVNKLLSYTNNSLQAINNKKKDLNDLVDSVQNFTDLNTDKSSKIDANCMHASDQKIEKSELELDQILEKIYELASKINVQGIQAETEESRVNSQELNLRVKQIAANLPEIDMGLNKTRGLYDREKAKSDNATQVLSNFTTQNDNVQSEIKTSESNIENIEIKLNGVQQSILDLKNSVDVDSTEKPGNQLAKQESLKSKVKESRVTLERTKINLESLQKKSEELTKTFESLIQTKDKDKNSAELLESLINLQSDIIKKKNMVDQKTSKIEKLQKHYTETKTRITELKNTLVSLKVKAVDIKTDIQSKEKYFNTCS